MELQQPPENLSISNELQWKFITQFIESKDATFLAKYNIMPEMFSQDNKRIVNFILRIYERDKTFPGIDSIKMGVDPHFEPIRTAEDPATLASLVRNSYFTRYLISKFNTCDEFLREGPFGILQAVTEPEEYMQE